MVEDSTTTRPFILDTKRLIPASPRAAAVLKLD